MSNVKRRMKNEEVGDVPGTWYLVLCTFFKCRMSNADSRIMKWEVPGTLYMVLGTSYMVHGTILNQTNTN